MEGADFRYVVLAARAEDWKPSEIAQALAAARKIPLQDAARDARRAWGILGESLTKEAASDLAVRLKQASVETVVLPGNLLEELPAAANVSSIEFLPGKLEAQIKAGDKAIFALDSIRLISAAGIKQTIVTKTKVKEGPSSAQRAVSMGLMMVTGLPLPIGGKSQEVEKKTETTDLFFYLDLITRSPARRLRINAQEFNYACLRARMGYSIPQNFRTLVQELVRFCPTAHKGRGTQVLLDGTPVSTMGYDAVEDLERESRWRLTLDSIRNP